MADAGSPIRPQPVRLAKSPPGEAHPHAEAARARKKAEAEAIGITDEYIDRFVDAFYAKVREDAILGPIFNARVHDWPAHLATLKRFWASVLHNAGTYSGRPMPLHIAIPEITRSHFDHWLALFRQTLDELAPASAATEAVHARARMIADSLMHGIAIHRDGKLSA